MVKDKVRPDYFEPHWFKAESEYWGSVWEKTETKDDIVDFVLKNASDEFRAEYNRAMKTINKASS